MRPPARCKEQKRSGYEEEHVVEAKGDDVRQDPLPFDPRVRSAERGPHVDHVDDHTERCHADEREPDHGDDPRDPLHRRAGRRHTGCAFSPMLVGLGVTSGWIVRNSGRRKGRLARVHVAPQCARRVGRLRALGSGAGRRNRPDEVAFLTILALPGR
jgi:hypothetical protein